jgi:hypothetical protein
MKHSSDDWSVECKPSGSEGYFFYHEGLFEIPFRWEYGGGSVRVIISFDKISEWDKRYPWAVGRKLEIY